VIESEERDEREILIVDLGIYGLGVLVELMMMEVPFFFLCGVVFIYFEALLSLHSFISVALSTLVIIWESTTLQLYT